MALVLNALLPFCSINSLSGFKLEEVNTNRSLATEILVSQLCIVQIKISTIDQPGEQLASEAYISRGL